MHKILNTLKYLFFLSIGIFVFLKLYKEYDLTEFMDTMKELSWGWIVLSFVFAILSHLSRAIRWNMLIKPTIGFQPKLMKTFFAVMILYVTNLIIPRGGEIARCSVLSKYEKIPFGKLVGTVVTERATDTLLLFILVFITIFFQIGIFNQFIENNPEFGQNFGFFFTTWFWLLAALISITGILVIWKLRRKLRSIKIINTIFDMLYNFFEGIKSIRKLEKPGTYIFHSIFIYIMYFLMMYVVFLAYTPTKSVGLITGLTTFIMAGLAMLAPVQAGIGAWHFMVIETLHIYGINKLYAKEFALISHTSMNLLLLILGGLCFILLPFIYRKKLNSKT